jgi:hypothetical protein
MLSILKHQKHIHIFVNTNCFDSDHVWMLTLHNKFEFVDRDPKVVDGALLRLHCFRSEASARFLIPFCLPNERECLDGSQLPRRDVLVEGHGSLASFL